MSYSKNDDEATIANVPKRTKGNNHIERRIRMEAVLFLYGIRMDTKVVKNW